MNGMNAPDSMDTTSSQVLDKLRQKKADIEFRWTPEGFTTGEGTESSGSESSGSESSGSGRVYQPEDLVILRTFRFEGASNPSDMEILYIIRAKDGLIGYSLDAYGAYSSHDDEGEYDNFIRQIPEAGHDQQITFEL